MTVKTVSVLNMLGVLFFITTTNNIIQTKGTSGDEDSLDGVPRSITIDTLFYT